MKSLIAGLALLCAAAAICPRAVAQITITATDVSTQFAVGNFVTNRFDSTVTSVNIGRKGSTSWDFSGLHKSNSVQLTSVTVSSAFNAAAFPAATIALQTNIIYNYQGTNVAATAYLFFQLATNLMNLGETASISGGSASLLATNTPADLFYKLPSTYGTTWTSTYFDTTSIFLGTFFISGSGAHHNASYVVDAYGPLTIPGGSVHDVLRIKKTDSTTAKSVGYIFIGKDGTLLQVSAASASAPDTGTISIIPPVSWTDAVNTSAPAARALPEKFSLGQNYPNPFNPSTLISYALPARSRVVLAVYNVLGQRVAELVNGEVEAGNHSIEWRPATSSGIYFCRIEAVALDNPGSGFNSVMKMAYIR